jgi:phospholipid/cholesterol/gamma-HCH transport system permease protein
MREWADFTVQEAGGRTTIVLTGPLLVSSIGVIDRRLREFGEPVQFVDIGDAGAIDTVGAWIVARFADEHRARIVGASEQAEKLLETVRASASSADIEPPRRPLLEGAL